MAKPLFQPEVVAVFLGGVGFQQLCGTSQKPGLIFLSGGRWCSTNTCANLFFCL